MAAKIKRRNPIVSHIRLLIESTKLNLYSAMEYKFNFIMYALGMFINDIFWLALWFILFTRFENLNGWVFKDILLLYSVLTVSFGIVFSLFGSGKLDYYLTLPKNVLFHSSLKMSYSAVGDLLFGLALAPFAIGISDIPLYLYFLITGGILFFSITLIFNSLSFFIGSSERLGGIAFESILSLASYPLSVYGGITKFILLTLLPAGLISGIPVQVIRRFDLTWFLLTGAIAIVFLTVAILIFYKGLKRYESGNLLYAKD